MRRATTLLTNMRRIIKLYDSMLKPVCEHYDLTLMEAAIVSFLYNNPGKDTAADIVEFRMLAKSNVSQAVESLIQKGLLTRSADQNDRRKIHLSLLSPAKEITNAIHVMQKNLYGQIFNGLSEEDLKIYERINQKIMENTTNAIKERNRENEFTTKERQ